MEFTKHGAGQSITIGKPASRVHFFSDPTQQIWKRSLTSPDARANLPQLQKVWENTI